MPYDSQGRFYRVHNWEQDRINEIEIVSDRHDEEDDNFAEGLSSCLLKDGRAAMTGKLNMSNFKIQNVANATAAKDAVNKSQLDTVSSAGVKLTGNQTIGGNKTFSGTTSFSANPQINNTAPELIVIESDVIKGQIPNSTQYASMSFRDSSGDATGLLSRILVGYETDKESWISLSAFQCDSKPATTDGLVGSSVTMHYPASGSPYATAPNSDVVGSVVTTKSINKASSGYVELGNGLIMQWGKVASGGNAYVTITFPKTFSSATSYSITATQRSSSSSLASSSAVSIYNPSATSVKVASRAINESSTNDYFYWTAIGY
jgi:hypothetical protein